MEYWHVLAFGVFPYLAGTVFLVGSWLRFDREQYTWKADSSQFMSKRRMSVASNLFHIGIIGLFFGHLIGLLMPHGVWHLLGISELAKQYVAMTTGGVLGLMCLVGGGMLWWRRLTNPRVRAAGRAMDLFILSWILVTLLLGLGTIFVTAGHAAHGSADAMLTLMQWAKSIVLFQPQPELMTQVEPIYRLHVLLGVTLFLLFPFTRLVHIWSVPLGYLGRAYQIVRTARRPAV